LDARLSLEKVAAFLLEMDKRLTAAGVMTLPMTRLDIADFLGVTLETVCRAFPHLHGAGVIDFCKRHREIIIRDRLRLAGEQASMLAAAYELALRAHAVKGPERPNHEVDCREDNPDWSAWGSGPAPNLQARHQRTGTLSFDGAHAIARGYREIRLLSRIFFLSRALGMQQSALKTLQWIRQRQQTALAIDVTKPLSLLI
jgi:hypothetical protein